jgi:hypothetical protein
MFTVFNVFQSLEFFRTMNDILLYIGEKWAIEAIGHRVRFPSVSLPKLDAGVGVGENTVQ